MTIKKLTVAAAIAVGIATCSLNQAMAACPCEQPMPTVTGPACPCEEALPVVTGPACPCQTPAPKCNKCEKALPDCECQKPAPCDPCEKKNQTAVAMTKLAATNRLNPLALYVRALANPTDKI